MTKNNKMSAFALLAISLVAIFYPDVGSTSRFLSVDEQGEERGLQAITPAPTPPPGMGFSCPVGQDPFTVTWKDVKIISNAPTQKVTLANGMQVTLSVTDTAPAQAQGWGKDGNGNLRFSVGMSCDTCTLLDPKGGSSPTYPVGYSTMEIAFDRELQGLYISISDVDSGSGDADAVRIRMFNAAGQRVATTISKTGEIKVISDYGFESRANIGAVNPGFEASLYAQAKGPVKTIALDQSMFFFTHTKNGSQRSRTIYPALDFSYCAPTAAPTPGPTVVPATPAPITVVTPAPITVVTPAPITVVTPAPITVVDSGTYYRRDSGSYYSRGLRLQLQSWTPAPITIVTLKPIVPATPAPVPKATTKPAPTPAPFAGGVNGDPLIMGLSGQLFKFDGRSGAWYSAVSSPSFQWKHEDPAIRDMP